MLGDLASFLREAETTDLAPLFDDDGDGTLNLDDPAPTNPCVPTAFVAVCGQDSDGDGQSDFQEGATVDRDGDELFDYQESATADSDGDGVTDQNDPANGNACIPNPTAGCPPAVPATTPLARILLLGLLIAMGSLWPRLRRTTHRGMP